jgi:hypothetical protein
MVLGIVNGSPSEAGAAGQSFTGSLNITGTLSGRVLIRGRSGLTINVDTIDAPVEVWADGSNHGRGGIEALYTFNEPNSNITVNHFVAGRLGAPYGIQESWYDERTPFFGGYVTIYGGMAPDTEISTVQPGANPQVRYDLPGAPVRPASRRPLPARGKDSPGRAVRDGFVAPAASGRPWGAGGPQLALGVLIGQRLEAVRLRLARGRSAAGTCGGPLGDFWGRGGALVPRAAPWATFIRLYGFGEVRHRSTAPFGARQSKTERRAPLAPLGVCSSALKIPAAYRRCPTAAVGCGPPSLVRHGRTGVQRREDSGRRNGGISGRHAPALLSKPA